MTERYVEIPIDFWYGCTATMTRVVSEEPLVEHIANVAHTELAPADAEADVDDAKRKFMEYLEKDWPKADGWQPSNVVVEYGGALVRIVKYYDDTEL